MTMTKRTLTLLSFLAIAVLTGCASTGPNPEDVAKEMYSRETLLGVAERSVQENNLTRALGIYQQLLSRNGNDRQILTSAAVVAHDLQEYELSAAYYEQLLVLSPGDMDIRQELAEVNIQRQQYDAAESELKSLAEAMPQNWRAWNSLGLIADLRGNYADSEQFYAKAIDANPTNADIRNNRGYSLIMSHRYAEAVDVLRDGMRLDADNSRLHNNLLISLAWLGRYEDAVSAGRASLDEWIAYNNVGYIAQLKGDYDAAVRLYNAALSSSPRYYPTAATNLDAVLSLKDKRK